MHFELQNSVQKFRWFVCSIVLDLIFLQVYIEDLLVSSSIADEHRQTLMLISQSLLDYRIVISPDNSERGGMKMILFSQKATLNNTKPR